ncbi:cupin [Sphingomonas metalli]|uniref:Cupin n=1 Tax=Sphingomonas metalli TaxID=1779358 RepID=A0A916T3N7_9SPHN|nr:cupin-like domain-containing protein [Sphingomonas metalli]GGB27317.1 cupin [Sphingomonas metalli]
MTLRPAEADRSALASAEQFRREIAEPCRPVILRGAIADWPMAQAAAQGHDALIAYLTGFAAQTEIGAFVGAPAIAGRYHYSDDLSGFNFTRETMPLAAALDRIGRTAGQPGAPSIYAGSLPTNAFLPGLAAANPLAAVPAGVAPRLWIGHGSTVACHYDTLDNIACVVAGQRRFTLYPPEAIGDLYVGPIDHTMAGQPVSLAADSAPGDPRYPRFERWREQAIVADLGPGDALYLPKLWWHRVEATAPLNLLINYWWDAFPTGPDQPFATLLLAMAAIAERPLPERRAWQAWFDHYAFRPDRHPLDHLPPERHGILAAIPGNLATLRAHAMRMLRGGR